MHVKLFAVAVAAVFKKLLTICRRNVRLLLYSEKNGLTKHITWAHSKKYSPPLSQCESFSFFNCVKFQKLLMHAVAHDKKSTDLGTIHFTVKIGKTNKKKILE